MVEERDWGTRLADLLTYAVVAFLGISCLLPFLNTFAYSLSSRAAIDAGRVTFWPIGFHLENYDHIMGRPEFVRSTSISIARVLIGVSLELLVCVLTAYPLSRDYLPMPGRTAFKMVLLFGMLFSGGLIPYFLIIKNLGLFNKFAVLVIPQALNIFHTIIVINYFRGIPRELAEAAEMDGASHLDILFRVFLPISTPVLATVGLFGAVIHWNSWFDGIVYMQSQRNWPLQSYVYGTVVTGSLDMEIGWGSISQVSNITIRGVTGAFLLFASIPILVVYPFLQRYFITGLTLGSVKQ